MADDNQETGKAVKAKAAKATKAAKGALGAVGGLVGGAAAAASSAAKAAGDAVGDVAGGAVDAAKGAVSGVADAVGDVAGGAVDAAKGAVSGVAGAVGDVAGGAADLASKGVGAVGDAVSGVTDAVGDVVGGAADLAGKGVGAVTSAVGDVAGGAADLAGKGVGAVAGVGAAALGAVGGLAGGLSGGLGGGSDDQKAAGAYSGRGRLAGAEEDVDRTGGGWFVPLVGLIGIVGLAWVGAGMFFGKKTEEVAVTTPAAPTMPAWLTAIGDSLKANFAWLGLGGSATQVIASGTAPDQAAKDGALAGLQAALTASTEGKDARIIDNITVTGSADTPVGAALAALGANPDVAACQKAFVDTMAGRTINFTTGSAVINESSRSLLNALTGIATACKEHTVEIGGHTDTVGLPENNQRLSQSRAEAVKALWVAAGVAEGELSAVGYGETKLKEATADQTANEANRRIEFTVTEKGAAPVAAPAAPSAPGDAAAPAAPK
jgi:outer membrane protein OmpA-like peptidoglycan-associated protein